MNRMEDLNVQVCPEAITCKSAIVSEGGKALRAKDQQGRCWLEASARHRDASIADRHHDRRHHESHWMAAAFGARLSCWRRAQAPQAEARLQEGERQSDLPDRERRQHQGYCPPGRLIAMPRVRIA